MVIVKLSGTDGGRTDDEVHVLDHGRRAGFAISTTGIREIDGATDVLSFPDGDELPSGRAFSGEIVVSLDTARRQAGELGHGELRELEELRAPRSVALLGYDHETGPGTR